MLICKERIAPHGRNDFAVEAGARGRLGLEAPVRVPVFRKERGLFIGAAGNGDDVLAAGDGGDEGVMAEAPKVLGEAFEIVVRQVLLGKGEHVMFKPRLAQGGDGFRRQFVAKIDAPDGRPEALATFFYRKHVISPQIRLINAFYRLTASATSAFSSSVRGGAASAAKAAFSSCRFLIPSTTVATPGRQRA